MRRAASAREGTLEIDLEGCRAAILMDSCGRWESKPRRWVGFTREIQALVGLESVETRNCAVANARCVIICCRYVTYLYQCLYSGLHP